MAVTFATLMLVYDGSAWVAAAVGDTRGWLVSFVNGICYVLGYGGTMAVIELATAEDSEPGGRMRALMYWAVYLVVAQLAGAAANAIRGAFGLVPLVTVDFGWADANGWGGWIKPVGLLITGALVFDFFYYWFHRLQHRWSWLWAFHATHHSIRNMNGLACYHHPLEDLIRLPFIFIPMAVLIEVPPSDFVLGSLLVGALAWFSHMRSWVNLGAARHFVIDNHYHRVHHSVEARHHNRNFAGIFPLWDRLFGTQYMPPPSAHRLPVGLDDQDAPATMTAYLMQPFRHIRLRWVR